MYRKIWGPNGSPLLNYSTKLKKKLEKIVPADTDVYLAMRYGRPGLASCLHQIKKKRYGQVTLLPLFPQYASSTSGSLISFVMKKMRRWEHIPDIRIISSFFDNPNYIRAMVSLLRDAMNKYENHHVLFSFHSVPLRHVYRAHDNVNCSLYHCEHTLNERNAGCYKATCYETARLISQAAGIKENNYTVSFQSQFGRKWLGPFTKDVIKELPGNGIRNVIVISPSFISDCLETLLELNQDYRELFLVNGGESYVLVESLNDTDEWVKGLADITGTDF